MANGRRQLRRPWLRWGAGVGVAGLVAIGAAGTAFGFEPPRAQPLRDAGIGASTVPLTRLPGEAQSMHRAIRAGGPFAGPKDGAVFANRERLLPGEQRGYYREYTVPTPGAHNRGARRIVCGGRVPAAPATCWYTADHYATFARIAP